MQFNSKNVSLCPVTPMQPASILLAASPALAMKALLEMVPSVMVRVQWRIQDF